MTVQAKTYGRYAFCDGLSHNWLLTSAVAYISESTTQQLTRAIGANTSPLAAVFFEQQRSTIALLMAGNRASGSRKLAHMRVDSACDVPVRFGSAAVQDEALYATLLVYRRPAQSGLAVNDILPLRWANGSWQPVHGEWSRALLLYRDDPTWAPSIAELRDIAAEGITLVG